MFDIDSGKLLIVAVLALIVIGPKELPRVLRQVGQAVGKMRRMANEFQGQFMDAMKEADIADIRKELDDLNKTAAIDVHFDPVRDIQAELTSPAIASPATSSDVPLQSPAGGFELPLAAEAGEPALTAAGIAPTATGEVTPDGSEPNSPVDVADHVNGAGVLSDHEVNGASDGLLTPKRKIFVKRRRSSFNIMQADAKAVATGEPFAVRQRIVRPKAIATQSAQSS